jgi:PGF-pre-PGF domain-containing protein
MGKFILLLISLVLVSSLACAGEIRAPVYPTHFEGSLYEVTGTNAPSMLRELELLHIDTSDGFTIDSDHFYYAGLNSNSNTDYLGADYEIKKIDYSEVILQRKAWDTDEIDLNKGKPLAIIDGYALELVDIEKDIENGNTAYLVLKKDGSPVDSDVVGINDEFTYSKEYAGEDIVVFSTTINNIFSGNATKRVTLEDPFIRRVKVIHDGDSLGEDYTIDLQDIDNDGDIDIVVHLIDGKTLSLNDDETLPILDNYLFIRCGMMYNSFYDELDTFSQVANDTDYKVYAVENQNLNTSVTDFLQYPPSGSIIAVGPSIDVNTKVSVAINKPASLTIDRTLRGGHTFYTYIDDETLEFTVTKQDMNWYDGSDYLKITVYSDNDENKGTITIPDDGDATNSGAAGPSQTQTLSIPDLGSGVYKVVMSGGADLYIQSITTEQDKLIADKRLFVISSQTAYTEMKKGGTLQFQTYHDTSLQTITITNGTFTEDIDVDQRAKWFEITLPSSDTPYEINIPKGDMIIESSDYLSFTEDSYFNPTSCTVLSLENNMAWVEDNGIDYIVVPADSEQFGFYVFKKTGSTYDVRSSTDTGGVYTIDSWTNPSLFHFNFDVYRTHEYLTLDDSEGTVIDKDHFSYESIQTARNPENATVFDWSLAYLGTPYHVLSIDSSKAILSTKIVDDMEATLTYDNPLKLDDEYSLVLNEIDQNGDLAYLSLKKGGTILKADVVRVGDVFYYNTTINETEVSIFGAQVDSVFSTGSNGIIELDHINLIDDNPTIIRASSTIGTNYVTELKDLNNDGRTDLRVRLDGDNTISLNEGRSVSILDGFLTIVVEDNGHFYISRNIKALPAADRSNIKNEEQYVLSWLMPTTDAVCTFEKSSITEIRLNLNQELSSVYFAIQELKERPADIAPLEGKLYGLYNLTIDPLEISSASIDFRIEKTWLNENNLSKSNVKLARYHDDNWESLDTVINDEDNTFVYYSSTTPEFSVFAIYAEKLSAEMTVDDTYETSTSQEIQAQTPSSESIMVQYLKMGLGLLGFILIFAGIHIVRSRRRSQNE